MATLMSRSRTSATTAAIVAEFLWRGQGEGGFTCPCRLTTRKGVWASLMFRCKGRRHWSGELPYFSKPEGVLRGLRRGSCCPTTVSRRLFPLGQGRLPAALWDLFLRAVQLLRV